MTRGPFVVPLAGHREPAELIPHLSGRDHPAALWGDWFGGGAVLLHSPLRTLAPATAIEAAAVLDEQLLLDATGTGLLGGGWLCCLGFDPGTTWLGCYDHVLRWQPGLGWRFEALGLDGRSAAYADALEVADAMLAAPTAGAGPPQVSTFSTLPSPAVARERYLAAVELGIGRIRAGAFYQVNLTTRLQAAFRGDPAALFAQAAEQLRPAYGALVPGPVPVVSLSPELFLRVEEGRVTTAPIKGTAPSTGAAAASRLRGSAKDAAENVMIVDLMRNDLSRVASPGSVVVEDLLEVEPHVGVSHLVSTVSGELSPGTTLGGLLTAAFPPGSVTGAPKSSAVRGIAELEGQARGAYTGAVGFATPTAGAEFSVLIRSFEVRADRLELGVGAGITVDSVPVREWQECLDKAAPLVHAAGSALDPPLEAHRFPLPGRPAGGLLETLLVRRGRVLRLADHLARLDRSCRELYGRGLPADLSARVGAVATAHAGADRVALRVEVEPGGELGIRVSARALGPSLRRSALRHAARANISWRHKWRDRHDLEAAERAVVGAEGDALVLPYFTVGEEVTETSRGNLFCRAVDGRWLTPVADEHLLPGVTRREVIDLLDGWGHQVVLGAVNQVGLRASAGAFWTSSLSGAVSVGAVDGCPLPDVSALVEQLNQALGTAA